MPARKKTTSKKKTASKKSTKKTTRGGDSKMASSAKSGSAAEDGNIDKVRDILFGAQAREIDQRFARLEERLAKEAADTKAELIKRIDSLEAFTKKGLDGLRERLRDEKTERTSQDKELGKELRDLNKATEKSLATVEQQLEQAEAELQQEILTQSKELMDELVRRTDELTATIRQETDDLRDEKASRAVMAALFNEMAISLNEELAAEDDGE